MIYSPSSKTTYKVLYGQAFRNPNAYERYYEGDVFNAPNPVLGPEKIDTVEATVERRLTKRTNFVASVYRYWLRDLIEGVPIGDDFFQFQNSSRLRAVGAEFEVNGRVHDRLRLAASFSVQKPTDDGFGLARVNSPRRMGKFRFAVPLVGDKLHFSGAFRYLSSRQTLFAGPTRPVALGDATFSTVRLHPNFDLRFGVRNLFNRRYYDPVGPEHVSTRLLQRGRTAFVKLIVHKWE